MPFKVLNSRTVIIVGERVLSEENSNYLSLNYFYLLFLNKAWKDIPKNKVKKIYELLSINDNSSLRISKDIIFLSPRNGSQSPWSSKTEDIFASCNLSEIQRIERIKGLETEGFSEKLLKKENFPFDYLTEEFSIGLSSIESFFTKPNKNSFSFKYLKNNHQSYIDANQKFGFGLNDQEINYLVNSYESLNRNPTDVELMMFSQANSEHCRHKFFNATWKNLSKENEPSLFQQIKSTHKNFKDGVLVAYDDNAAVIESESSKKFHLDTAKKEYQAKDLKHNICIKVETHNHPTAVSPFEGAATGSGGEIRDEGATGIGAQPKAGLSGYSVSYLRLESLKEKWEFEEDRPKRISSPKKIMIEGPLGAASFNNEFGRPNLNGYFRSFEQKNDGTHYGFHKPIMIAGGLGSISSNNTFKKKVKPGTKIIVLGGPGYLIGLGGGSASSVQAGSSDESLDYASVQRSNPEMQRRCQEVINLCSLKKSKNPILFIHDVGAGGLSNAIPELAKDCSMGASIDLRKIPLADNSMSALEIWSNESQERYVLAVEKDSLKEFEAYCEREKCPHAVVGTLTANKIFKLKDSKTGKIPIHLPMDTIFGYKEKNTHEIISDRKTNFFDKSKKIHLKKTLLDVLRHPTVGSKSFLINIGDRSVGGLTYRDQFVGPYQVPVADHAITLSDFSTNSGEAMAMGEKSPIATSNPVAAGKLALAEALINLLPSGVSKLSNIKISANWMASPDNSQRKTDLFNTVKELTQKVCNPWRIAVPVGKDSLSMKTIWQKDKKTNLSPQSLIISAFAKIKNVKKSITPQLIDNNELSLVYLDLSKTKKRLGGSILSEVTQQINLETPNLECIEEFPKIYNYLAAKIDKKRIFSFHDISDGGLIVSAVEMMLAGGCGLDLDISKISFLKDSSSLFSEELGMLFQINKKDFSEFKKDLKKLGLKNSFFKIGSTRNTNGLFLKTSSQSLKISQKVLMNSWSSVSYNIKLLRDNEETTKQEHRFLLDKKRSKLTQKFNFKLNKRDLSRTPKIAIMRDQGVNSHIEMAAAFSQAGFKVIDVHMQDLLKNSSSLDNFQGLAFPGGFSYGDVLGAGRGWAQSIKSNSMLKDKFSEFFHRQDTFALGICNGCQVMSELKELIPGSDHWPKLERNNSNRFEARMVQVKINKSNSKFFKDMEGSQLLVPVNHGEGKMIFPEDVSAKKIISDNLVPMQFCTNKGIEAKEFPENPNGSIHGITAVTNDDGRFLIMMPHPERSFLNNQLSWTNENVKHSPWFKLFLNARNFYS
jgi:phosphoribosylformylglycinamidine synthase